MDFVAFTEQNIMRFTYFYLGFKTKTLIQSNSKNPSLFLRTLLYNEE